MKNYVGIVSVLALIALVACKKDYTCECQYAEASTIINLEDTTFTYLIPKTTEKDAKSKCDAFQTEVVVSDSLGTLTDTLDTSCGLLARK